ncbi:MAG: hypothetical protein C4323_26025, partial [Mastigocladus sp. ERB_26_2]
MILIQAKVFHNALVKNDKVENNFQSIINVIDMMKLKVETNGGKLDFESHPLISQLLDNAELSIKGSMLNNALNRIIDLSNLADETNSSIFSSVDNMVLPFLQNERLLAWSSSTKSTFDLSKVLIGEKFGINLPEKVYGMAGVAIAKMLKAKVYNSVYNRGEAWSQQEGQQRVYFVIDECHLLMDGQDASMLSIMAG